MLLCLFLAHVEEAAPRTSLYRRPAASRELSASDVQTCFADCESEQVHVALGGPGELVISFATTSDVVSSHVDYWDAASNDPPLRQGGAKNAYSQLMYILEELMDPTIGGPPGATAADILALQDTTSWASRMPFFPFRVASLKNTTGETKPKHGLQSYKNPAMIYNSPVLHTVTLPNLSSGVTYAYRVAGLAKVFNVTYPPSASANGFAYPYTVGLTADLGQTQASRANVEVLRARLTGGEARGSVVLLGGDLSYADGYYSRWDSWARMMQPLAASVPILTTGGNHEIGAGEAWVSYNARYPMPHASSNSPSNLWWSRDVGPIHVISVCSYAATAPGSLQHSWLARDLRGIDRASTPWVVVMMHAPWYNSNSGHVGEAELMRRDMEGMLYNHSVDLVLSGHVHAYERTTPLYDGCVDACGPIYLNLGDGGNREGAYVPWQMPQPDWSAFRESSFGVGFLKVVNASHAYYDWTRAACATMDANEDHITLDALHCATQTVNHGDDNSEDPSAYRDGVWIVRNRNMNAAAQCGPASSCDRTSGRPSDETPGEPSPTATGGDSTGTFTMDAVLAAAATGFLAGMLVVGVVWTVCAMRQQNLVIKRRRPFTGLTPASAEAGAVTNAAL